MIQKVHKAHGRPAMGSPGLCAHNRVNGINRFFCFPTPHSLFLPHRFEFILADHLLEDARLCRLVGEGAVEMDGAM